MLLETVGRGAPGLSWCCNPTVGPSTGPVSTLDSGPDTHGALLCCAGTPDICGKHRACAGTYSWVTAPAESRRPPAHGPQQHDVSHGVQQHDVSLQHHRPVPPAAGQAGGAADQHRADQPANQGAAESVGASKAATGNDQKPVTGRQTSASSSFSVSNLLSFSNNFLLSLIGFLPTYTPPPEVPLPRANFAEVLRNSQSELEHCCWYHGSLSWQESAMLLQNSEEGTFLVRDSQDP